MNQNNYFPKQPLHKAFEVGLLDEHVDIELSNHAVTRSIDISTQHGHEEQGSSRNYMLGVLYFSISTSAYACMISFAKVTLMINPSMTPFDLGIVRCILLLVSITLCAYKYSIRLFDFDTGTKLVNFNTQNIYERCWDKVRPYLCIPVAALDAISIVFILHSMEYISATKSALIFQCYPLVSLTLAALCLKQVICKHDKIACACMIIGCIVISLHKSQSASLNENPVLGYTLATVACFTIGLVMVMLQVINQKKHFLVFPYFFAWSFLAICLIAYAIDRDNLNFSKHTTLSFTTCCLSAFGSLFGITFLSLSYKHADASQLAPLNGIQNLLNFLAEYFLLSYDFALSDVVGMLILMFSFCYPVLAKVYKS